MKRGISCGPCREGRLPRSLTYAVVLTVSYFVWTPFELKYERRVAMLSCEIRRHEIKSSETAKTAERNILPREQHYLIFKYWICWRMLCRDSRASKMEAKLFFERAEVVVAVVGIDETTVKLSEAATERQPSS